MVRLLLTSLVLLLLPVGLIAQSAGRKKADTRQPVTVEQARQLSKEDPAAAIRLLDQLIQAKVSSEDLADAFVLLGDIYVDIDQPELALGRYGQAAELLSTGGEDAGELARKRGIAELRLENYASAKAQFEVCLSLATPGSPLDAVCREGLADVEARLNNLQVSQSYYSQAKEQAPDSLSKSRINAKQANVYIQQNDLQNAAISLNTAIQQAPRNQSLPQAESEELLAANTNVRGAVLREAPKLDVAVVDVLPSAPAELVLSDEFARFRALREVGEIRLAEEKLERALNRVDETTPKELATEVYAEGADFYLERDLPRQAADAYRSYTLANDELLAEQRSEISRQVAVLREQQNVDLGLKDLSAAAVEGALLERQMNLRLWLNYLLGALLLGALLSVFLILRNVRKRRRVNQELLLRNLQTRMNPHFIFNSLNSINNYIARQDERSANRYLGRFAKLMRKVLDQSGKDFVPLSEELEQLGLYLELEKERFGDQFNYDLDFSEDVLDGAESVDIPPMILQPFVENAIWHGLRYRPEGGVLSVRVITDGERPVVVISDNGIGREKSAALKTDNQRRHRSSGMATSRQRIDLVNEHYGRSFKLEINDADSDPEFVGTEVKVYL